MEMIMKFINCNSYDFTADNGMHYSGYTCHCYDPSSKKIIKCKSNKMIDSEFGEEIEVLCTPNGRYLNYSVVA